MLCRYRKKNPQQSSSSLHFLSSTMNRHAEEILAEKGLVNFQKAFCVQFSARENEHGRFSNLRIKVSILLFLKFNPGIQ